MAGKTEEKTTIDVGEAWVVQDLVSVYSVVWQTVHNALDALEGGLGRQVQALETLTRAANQLRALVGTAVPPAEVPAPPTVPGRLQAQLSAIVPWMTAAGGRLLALDLDLELIQQAAEDATDFFRPPPAQTSTV
jgi:hypothetical protein